MQGPCMQPYGSPDAGYRCRRDHRPAAWGSRAKGQQRQKQPQGWCLAGDFTRYADGSSRAQRAHLRQDPAPDPHGREVAVQRLLRREAGAVALLVLPQHQRAWCAQSGRHRHCVSFHLQSSLTRQMKLISVFALPFSSQHMLPAAAGAGTHGCMVISDLGRTKGFHRLVPGAAAPPQRMRLGRPRPLRHLSGSP